MKILFIQLLLFLSFNSKAIHPVHLGIASIEENKKLHLFEITLKLFVSDLHIAYTHSGLTNHSIDGIDSTHMISFILQYVETNFSISFNNNSAKKMKFIKQEVIDDAIFLTYRIKEHPRYSTISIKNRILLDIFPDQINLLFLNCKGKQVSEKMGYKDHIKTFQF